MQHMTRVHASIRTIGACALGVVLAASLCPLPSSPVAFADTAAEKQAEAEAALANLNAMQETLDRLSAEYGEALAAQEDAESSRDAAESRITEISGEIEDLQGRLGARARDMYRSGSIAFVDILLGSRSFEEFATSWDMLNKVNESDVSMVEEQRELRNEAEEQARIFNEQARVATQKSQEAAEAAQQAENTVAEMQATYESLSAEAAQLLEEERAAQEAAEAARAAAIVAESVAAAQAAEEAAAAQAQFAQPPSDSGGGSTTSSRTASRAVVEEDDDEEDATTIDDSASTTSDEEEESESDSSTATYEGGSDTVSRAYACLGAPYVWGGVGPDGYDCSGLVSYCLTGSHTRLGTTYTFMGWPQVSDPQPGDICVNSGHTGIYIGDGQMIHAATYGVGVIVGPVQSGMIIVRYQG